MEQQIKENWVKALRSGEYKQGKGSLQSINNIDNKPTTLNCCLAILGKVNGLEIEEKGESFKNDNEVLFEYGDYYPSLVELGLNDKQQRDFVEMNDAQGKTFEEIAGYIEKNL